MKANVRTKNKTIQIDTGAIRRELESTFNLPGTKRKVARMEEIVQETANDVIEELNKRSSMRENQGGDSPYFTRPDINRGVFNQPFSNASVTKQGVAGNSIKTQIRAPITSTKSGGRPVDLFDILENGRPAINLGKKKAVFPVTRTGAERLIKMRLTGVKNVRGIFRAQRARYKKKDGKIVLVFTNKLAAIQPRGILGVLARDIEGRIEKEQITLKTLGIKGSVGKGRIKVKVN